MKKLGQFIESSKIITQVFIGENPITDQGIRDLLSFHPPSSLRVLDVGWCAGISDETIPNFVQAIESSDIENVNADGTSITTSNPIYIACLGNKVKHGATSVEVKDM